MVDNQHTYFKVAPDKGIPIQSHLTSHLLSDTISMQVYRRPEIRQPGQDLLARDHNQGYHHGRLHRYVGLGLAHGEKGQ